MTEEEKAQREREREREHAFHGLAARYASAVLSQMTVPALAVDFRMMVGIHIATVSAAQDEHMTETEFVKIVKSWYDRYKADFEAAPEMN